MAIVGRPATGEYKLSGGGVGGENLWDCVTLWVTFSDGGQGEILFSLLLSLCETSDVLLLAVDILLAFFSTGELLWRVRSSDGGWTTIMGVGRLARVLASPGACDVCRSIVGVVCGWWRHCEGFIVNTATCNCSFWMLLLQECRVGDDLPLDAAKASPHWKEPSTLQTAWPHRSAIRRDGRVAFGQPCIPHHLPDGLSTA